MKKLLFLLLAFCSLQAFSQSKLTALETRDLWIKTNNMFVEFYDEIIQCMIAFDQVKFDNAEAKLKLIVTNYDIIERMGTFTGSGAMTSSARRSLIINKSNAQYWQIKLTLNYNKFKNDKRNKSVKYRYEKIKIPSSLAKLFKELVEESNEVSISNML